jgi:peptidoglycan/LPS O-acetylase OafA/YrhL
MDDHHRHHGVRAAFRSARSAIATPFPSSTARLTLKWLRTAGKYSYGMYVYHLLLFLPVRSYLLSDAASWIHLNFPEKILFMISEIMAVFVVAKLSYDHFEFRFLKFKRYFNPA